MTDEPLAILAASPARRWFAVGVLWLLAAMLVWLSLTSPPALGWQLFQVLLAAGAAYGGDRLRRATGVEIHLFPEGLLDSKGRPIAPLVAIRQVERGAFAFKPSNGFSLVLSQKVGKRAWTPGMWWRMGKRVGIGGVTPANASKFMAEQIAIMLAERDSEKPAPQGQD